MSTKYSYRLTESAIKSIGKLPKNIQQRIIVKLDFFVSTNDPLYFAHTLTNSDLGSYRFRVGDYRIVCDLDDDQIIIIAIDHRKEIYR